MSISASIIPPLNDHRALAICAPPINNVAAVAAAEAEAGFRRAVDQIIVDKREKGRTPDDCRCKTEKQ